MNKNKTLGWTLAAAFARAVFITAIVAGVAFVLSAMPRVAEVMPSEDGSVQVEKPNAKGSPVWFVEKYDCWTGEPPADMVGKFPGHVIVTEGGRTFRGGPTKVATALDHIFEGKPTEIETIHAFCR